jgi:hypothetical protein
LVGDPPGTDWTKDIYEASPERNLARAAEIAAAVPPNTQQKYSNLAYQLLGEVVARLSGMPYTDHVRAHILEPPGMTSTSYAPLPDALEGRRATGYKGRWMSDAFAEALRLPMFAHAEGGLWSCVTMARWIVAQFGEDGGTGGRRSSPDILRRCLPRYLGSDTLDGAWCIGWYAVRKGGPSGCSTRAGCRVHHERARVKEGRRDRAAEQRRERQRLAMSLGELALRRRVRRSRARPPASTRVRPDLLGLYGDGGALLFRLECRRPARSSSDETEARRPASEPDRFVKMVGVPSRASRVPSPRRRVVGDDRSVALAFDPVAP